LFGGTSCFPGLPVRPEGDKKRHGKVTRKGVLKTIIKMYRKATRKTS